MLGTVGAGGDPEQGATLSRLLGAVQGGVILNRVLGAVGGGGDPEQGAGGCMRRG